MELWEKVARDPHNVDGETEWDAWLPWATSAAAGYDEARWELSRLRQDGNRM